MNYSEFPNSSCFSGVWCDVCDELVEEADWPTHWSMTCGKYNNQTEKEKMQ